MSPKYKITAEEKIKLVHAYLSGKITQRYAGEAAGVSHATIQVWIKRYEAEGADAFYPSGKNRVYSPETKTQAVIDYLSGRGSQSEICRKYKIRSKYQLQTWIRVYNAHGDLSSRKHSGGGSYMSKTRNTRLEERLQIVQECLASDKNYGEMAKKYKVSYQQVRTWTLRYLELGKSGLEDRRGKRKKDQTPRTDLEKAQIETEKLKHQLYMAEMERDLLKKLNELEREDFLDK